MIDSIPQTLRSLMLTEVKRTQLSERAIGMSKETNSDALAAYPTFKKGRKDSNGD
ncbi:MAG TPA: hypothetical protein VKV40_08685 [Ktedonobacteraceae bacterium]|nr:hypothetical protein [Ktedonobacteraceae bacterium]